MKYNKKYLNNKKYKLKSNVVIKRGGASSNSNDGNDKNSSTISNMAKLLVSGQQKGIEVSNKPKEEDDTGNETNKGKDEPQNKENAEKKLDQGIDKYSMLVKTPAEYIVDNLQNFILNIGNLYMYVVSTIVNLPNSSLENIIPEKDGCKIIFGDKLTCKKKFKCLFKKCSMLEDPTGYMIKKSKENSLII